MLSQLLFPFYNIARVLKFNGKIRDSMESGECIVCVCVCVCGGSGRHDGRAKSIKEENGERIVSTNMDYSKFGRKGIFIIA